MLFLVRALQLVAPFLVLTFLLRYLVRRPDRGSLERTYLIASNSVFLGVMVLSLLTGLLGRRWMQSPVRPAVQAVAYGALISVFVFQHVLLHRARRHNAERRRAKRRYIEYLSRERDIQPPTR